MPRTLVVLAVAFVLLVLGVGTVSGIQATPEEEPGSDGLGLFEGFQDAISSVLLDLVQELTDTLTGLLNRIFVSYPDVKSPWVLETHQQVFTVSVALASAAVVWIGFLHMTNRISGVRPVVYVLGSVAFGAVSPSLLWYPVELSRLTTNALAPASTDFWAIARFSLEMVVVALLDLFLLLGIAGLFLARDVYLMIGVALSPMIALMTAVPGLRGYASLLTSIWVGCLLIGPVNVVVFDLILGLLSADTGIPHWLWAFTGLGLMFVLPLLLLGAGATMFGPPARLGNRVAGGIKAQTGGLAGRFGSSSDEDQWEGNEYYRSDRDNRFRRNQ